MLICSFPKWKNFALSEDLFEDFEILFKAKLIMPVTSFSQYVLLLTQSNNSKYDKKISNYFGTDIAKTLSSEQILQIKTKESLIILLCEYINKRTNSTLSTPGYGSTVYIYDNLSKNVVYTLNNYRLEDYQERVDNGSATQFISKFDNIVIAMSKQYKQMTDIDILKSMETPKMSILFG